MMVEDPPMHFIENSRLFLDGFSHTFLSWHSLLHKFIILIIDLIGLVELSYFVYWNLQLNRTTVMLMQHLILFFRITYIVSNSLSDVRKRTVKMIVTIISQIFNSYLQHISQVLIELFHSFPPPFACTCPQTHPHLYILITIIIPGT